MPLASLWSFLSRRPIWVVASWAVLALTIGLTAPNLTKLAAEGQSKLLGRESESRRAAELVRQAWPDQAYESTAVLALHRPAGLTEADRQLAALLAQRFEANDRPATVLRVLGPASRPEIASRLTSRDGTVSLVVVPLNSAHVSPAAHQAVKWLEAQSREIAGQSSATAGLELRWTGDAVIGRDYMAAVQTSLDRAAFATVVLLLCVLLLVYRSLLLALVPMVTIGISLIISRGLLAWLAAAGWGISSLVELFLVALLFGTGTDFCLFLSWRFAEHFNPRNPAGVMRLTLSRSFMPLATSAGTIIMGLLLMGTTRFKLFSTTGPSVALGLALSLMATLSLTPALLVLLARYRPRSFQGFLAPSSGFWDRLGRKAMARPLRSWALTLLVMIPLSVLGVQSGFVMDLLSEMPAATTSGENLRLVASKFDPGMMAPLTVVLDCDTDLRQSEGLALIDEVSQLLSHQRRLAEVRSATQPLGSPKPLSRARLASRLGEVNQGFQQLASGARQLNQGLVDGATKLRAALWLEQKTGLNLTGSGGHSMASKPKAAPAKDRAAPAPATPPVAAPAAESPPSLMSGLRTASTALQLTQSMQSPWDLAGVTRAFDMVAVARPLPGSVASAGNADASVERTTHAHPDAPGASPNAAVQPQSQPAAPRAVSPAENLLAELTRAADGADQIAQGAQRAHREVAAILDDPVGRRALDRLLITPENVRSNPELAQSLAVYITPDGHHARIDVTQTDRVFSNPAMNQIETLRTRLKEFLGEYRGVCVTASVAGANAESADIRSLTHADQVQSWFIVPLGVFLVLLIALRDPWACFNLVATMVLTYAFALGATHLIFVTILGAEGLDWKVPYFLFVLLVAVGVDYNVFLMTRLHEETARHGFRGGIIRAIGQTGGLISSAAAITVCSFASFVFSPLSSLRQLGFALVVGITIDAVLVRPLLVPCGHWLLGRSREVLGPRPHRALRRDPLQLSGLHD
jgi:RND superfamily putative drug exporter